MKCHYERQELQESEPTFLVNEIDIKSKCTNRHIGIIWNSKFSNIYWETTCKFDITNTLKEVHYKVVHNIYSTNKSVSTFVGSDDKISIL